MGKNERKILSQPPNFEEMTECSRKVHFFVKNSRILTLFVKFLLRRPSGFFIMSFFEIYANFGSAKWKSRKGALTQYLWQLELICVHACVGKQAKAKDNPKSHFCCKQVDRGIFCSTGRLFEDSLSIGLSETPTWSWLSPPSLEIPSFS